MLATVDRWAFLRGSDRPPTCSTPSPLCVPRHRASLHVSPPSLGLNLGEEEAAAMAQNPEESPVRSMYCIRLRRQASGMETQWPTMGDLGTRWEDYECRWPLGPYA